MSDTRDPEHDHSPLPDDRALVFPKVHMMVADDVVRRMHHGEKKYGQALRPHNGRDVLKDIYEELLDSAAYIRQLIYERDGR